jgi:tetratricopeptide (TPR) repeat protein
MAIKDFDAAIEICPDDSSPYEYKATAYMEMNKPDLAKEYYEEALKVDPCNVHAFAQLAQLKDCEKSL